MNDESELKPGTALGPYVIEGRLGRGGMGDVYLARRPVARGVGRPVAIKVLLPALAADPDAQDSFVDEACLAALINDAHTVGVFDYDTEPLTYLAMEYVNGPSLAAFTEDLESRGMRWPPAMAIKITCDVLNGLAAAHELTVADGTNLGIVHRDVSPENILVGVDGVARVTDFGIARAADRLAHTEFGMLKGRSGYMAPEQLIEPSYDHRADLFSTGVILWELLAGRRLFEVGITARLTHPFIAIPKVPDLPTSLAGLLEKAVASDPDRRYQSARAFSSDLQKVARQHGWIATSAELARFMKCVRDEGTWPASQIRTASTMVAPALRSSTLVAAIVAGFVASALGPTPSVHVQAATTKAKCPPPVKETSFRHTSCPLAPSPASAAPCEHTKNPTSPPTPKPARIEKSTSAHDPEPAPSVLANCARRSSDGSIRDPWPALGATCN